MTIMRIAVIPARGGSKRIPRKNIKTFMGDPIISYSIRSAKDSKLFDAVIVSTDDDEIAQIAEEYGADVPFRRPADLADDLTATVPVIAHAVEAYSNLNAANNVEWACCIYPCSPFIHPDDIKNAAKLAHSKDVDFVYPVTEYTHPVQRAMVMDNDGKMSFIMSECELTRTQDLPIAYHDTGQFYFGKAAAWIGHKRMHTDGIGMAVPHWRVVDIDTPDDWKRAEALYQTMQKTL